MKNNHIMFLFILFLIVWGTPQSALTYILPYETERPNQDHRALTQGKTEESIFQESNKINTLILAENSVTSRMSRRNCRSNNGYLGKNYGYRSGYRDGFADGYRGRYDRNYHDYRYDRQNYYGYRDTYGERYYREDDDYRYNRRGSSLPYHRRYHHSIYDRR